MPAFIPLVAWFLLFIIYFNKSGQWRESFLKASLTWGILVTGITECLSIFKVINLNTLLFTWLSINALILVLFHKDLFPGREFIVTQCKLDSPIVYISFLGILFILITAGLIALATPPNNYDSMTYHMARIMHWIQNNSVAHYPTHITRQLYSNPWTEFAIMHLQVLSLGDKWANLVQWFSMAGSIIGTTLIAKTLGASIKEQWLTALIVVTIPMGILQASSTQNDFVVSFWLVCFIYFLAQICSSFKNIKSSPYYLHLTLWMGISLGLAILTKGTAYIYAFPFIIYFMVLVLRHLKFGAWKLIALLCVIIIAINFGHYLRNFLLFESPVFTYAGLKNETLSLGALFSNVIRNLGLYTGTPFYSLNQEIQQAIYGLHSLLHIDPNDPRTTFNSIPFNVSLGPSNNENSANNPLHFALILISLLLLPGMKKFYKYKELKCYAMAILISFLLFCLLIKWQPWAARLHLPLFVLMGPYVAICLSQKIGFNRRVILLMTLTIIISSLPWIFCNQTRPVIARINMENKKPELKSIITLPRNEQYFASYPELKKPFEKASIHIQHCNYFDIGIITGGDTYEYPLWFLLNYFEKKPMRIEHVNTNNQSTALEESRTFNPQCILIMRNAPVKGKGPGEKLLHDSHQYRLKWHNNRLFLYARI